MDQYTKVLVKKFGQHDKLLCYEKIQLGQNQLNFKTFPIIKYITKHLNDPSRISSIHFRSKIIKKLLQQYFIFRSNTNKICTGILKLKNQKLLSKYKARNIEKKINKTHTTKILMTIASMSLYSRIHNLINICNMINCDPLPQNPEHVGNVAF